VKKQEKQTKVLVYSHFHWDREWYRTFESFRFRLIKVVEQVLNLIQAGEYESFLLDGQTVILEDFLEMRPSTAENIAGLVTRKKLFVGPWYILPDEFLVSGESIIRNLLWGKILSSRFGKFHNIGYLPDMFGHIAQMPQILKSFNIDKAIVWRGANPQKNLFMWQGLDGTEILTSHLTKGYYNTFIINYENQKDDLPKFLEELKEKSLNDIILFPDGGDHLSPSESLRKVLSKINNTQKDYKFIHASLEEYFDQLHINLNKSNLEKIKGELRNNETAYILPGVFSARMYLKQKNQKLQTLITNWIEPLNVISWLLGNNYNQQFIDQIWKYLLQNQPHDNICGCSIDEVHSEMIYRYNLAEQISEELINSSMKFIAKSINLDLDYNYIIFYNPTNLDLDFIENVSLDFPKKDGIEYFKLLDLDNNEIDYDLLEKTDTKKFVSDIKTLPDTIEITKFKIIVNLKNIKAFSHKVIKIIPNLDRVKKSETFVKVDNSSIENKFVKLSLIDEKLKLTCFETRENYFINTFETSGDAGDEYNYSPPQNNIISHAKLISNEIVENNNLSATLKLVYKIKMPQSLEENSRTDLSKIYIDEIIESFVTIKADDPMVYIKTIVENKAKDHRLRVHFNSNYDNTEDIKCFYDTQFGILEKEFKVNDRVYDVEKYKERIEETFAIQSFCDLVSKDAGLSLITKGLPELEITSVDKQEVSLTLLRCVGYLSRDDLRTRGGGAGPFMETPDAQCLGTNTFEYALLPHQNTLIESNVFEKVQKFIVGTKYLQYKPKAESNFSFNDSLIELKPNNLIMSCLKRGENKESVVLRFFNPTANPVNYSIKLSESFDFIDAYIISFDETRISKLHKKNNAYFGTIAGYKIVTIEFTLY